MATFRGAVLVLALAASVDLSASVMLNQVVPLPSQVRSQLSTAAKELTDEGVQGYINSNLETFPLTVAQLKKVGSAVTSAIAAKGDYQGVLMGMYEELQLMMSRVYEVMDRYKSFDAYWSALSTETGAEVPVSNFMQNWQSFGVPKHAGTVYELTGFVYTPSSNVELHAAEMADADHSGTISKRELISYLHTCIEVSTNLMTTMTPGDILDKANTFRGWAGSAFEMQGNA